MMSTECRPFHILNKNSTTESHPEALNIIILRNTSGNKISKTYAYLMA